MVKVVLNKYKCSKAVATTSMTRIIARRVKQTLSKPKHSDKTIKHR